jgi:hypothetical protein
MELFNVHTTPALTIASISGLLIPRRIAASLSVTTSTDRS